MINSGEIFKASILIVDDDEAVAFLLEEMLRSAGYDSVASTRNPDEVCELYRKHRYDLILLDLQMRGMDGFQVMENMKGIEKDGYLPVLVITGQADHKLRALKAGAKDFISKPFDRAEILVRVHNMLEVRLLHLETRRLYEQIVADQKVSEQLLLVFRSGPVAVSINTIADGRIIDVNEEHCRFFGYSREEMVGRSVTDLNLWANPEDRAPVMQRLLKEGAMRGFEAKQRRRSGEVRDVLASFELIELAGESEPVLISMFTDITERKQAEEQLKETHKQLLVVSRQAGMAEVATGVLHNVGNVLNSVNIASSRVANSIKKSKAANLSKVIVLLREHEANLGTFLTHDPKGKQILGYLAQLAKHLSTEQEGVLQELGGLQKNIEHIKNIVKLQQGAAKTSNSTETVNVIELVEGALRMDICGQARPGVEVIKEFKNTPLVKVEKHKVLQILVNLLRNARYACETSDLQERKMIIRTSNGEDRVRIGVSDNGVGILPENLVRIFSYGFTTKKDGHGFGLHSAALTAKEMGGKLTVHSDGIGKGATFTLELPLVNPA